MSRFTGILSIVARVAGDEAANRLAISAGGTEMKLSARAGSRLVELVGQDAATALVDELGATKVVIPMGHLRGAHGRRVAAAQLLAQGVPQAKAALAVDVHQRTIERLAEKIRETEAGRKANPDLFDRD